MSALTYRNLDDEPAFAGVNTTTEALADTCDQLAGRIANGALDATPAASPAIAVTLRENPLGRASYERTP